ncbi:N5-glutamine S-adenosyl-L-methionine-dependent methyltransferase [Alcanivorax hongdengensis A-11-3]|uniref:Ribosomal protein uL3 glutamine methyltransferase n=1 Tax=Alcanivorax hongdengensis A-11-3 TaxID=1177179 RepID=L0WDI7_9GAMM|nr:50S ribosomal protein L3 N(5)-glutamine methyltransferase [Alcanivorax hongdengensis]EKF74848.1 N5-glutamine S-adenosyl-L-methionine-dependent methyltransferase [Alcanivorax hongdengensis A-11-3]
MISEQHLQEAAASLHTLRDCLRYGETCLRAGQVFYGHGNDDPWDEALALLLHTLSLPLDSDPRILDARLLPSEVAAYLALLVRRVNERVPVPYLTRQAWFCGLPFYVDERVLIPRSPLAELIEQQFAPWLVPEQVHRVLDLCTGSGCIAIACAYAFEQAQVDGSDISEDALAVCRENIARHGLEGQVSAVLSDGLAQVAGPYDLIVSNPPYVDARDMAALPDEYRHEPELALASGDDGLDFTRRLLREAPDQLSEQGVLIVEVGNSWEAMLAEWPEVPFFWFEFERGGHGVFMLTRQQLLEYRHVFSD